MMEKTKVAHYLLQHVPCYSICVIYSSWFLTFTSLREKTSYPRLANQKQLFLEKISV